MESDETRRAEALDRYWDALRRGEQPARPPEIGEAMAAFARHWSTTPPGADAARDRVWNALRAQMNDGPHDAAIPARVEETQLPPPPAHSLPASDREPQLNGHRSRPSGGATGSPDARESTSRRTARPFLPSVRLPALPAPASPGRWALAQASLALLLVVLAGGLWLTVRRDPGDTGEKAAGDPATVTVSAPVTGISAVYSSFVVRRLTLEPGSTFQELANGTTLFVIEHGTLTAVSSSGGEQLLGPNGSGSVQTGSMLTLRNDADETGGVIVASADPNAAPTLRTNYGPGVTPVTLATGVIKGPLPTDATMTLQRLTVPVGEQAASWQTDGPTWLRVEQGEAGLTLTGHGVPYPLDSGVEYFQSSGPPVQLARGMAVDVRNSGTTPLVLTIVDISPGSEPDSAPAT